MVAKLTGTLSEMLHREGNIWEPLNTHHFPGMKYVDPDLITHIIKSVQQFCGRVRQSRVAHRQPQVKLMFRRNVICFIHLSELRSLGRAYKQFFIGESDSQNLISLRQMYLVIAAFVTKATISSVVYMWVFNKVHQYVKLGDCVNKNFYTETSV